MKRAIGFVALGMGSIGVTACLAGLVAIWVERPTVLRSSAEILDAAEGGLTLVEKKLTRADELAQSIRGCVDPIAGKILKLADKAGRTPEQEKELKRIDEDLAERLRQVDAIAEVAETAVAVLNKTSRLIRSLQVAGSRSAGTAPEEESRDRSDALSRLARKLRSLREILARFRDDRGARREIVNDVVSASRDVNDDLKMIGSKLQEVRQMAAEWQAKIALTRTAVPVWTNWAAVIGSVLLGWLGLGQFSLARWGRACTG